LVPGWRGQPGTAQSPLRSFGLSVWFHRKGDALYEIQQIGAEHLPRKKLSRFDANLTAGTRAE
jgi:hypothetical protein